MTPRRILSLLFFAALALSTSAQAAVHQVEIVDFEFTPGNLTVAVGDSIRWVNNGDFEHTATSGTDCAPDGEFDSGLLAPGDEFVYVVTAEDAGQTVPYFCMPHCQMGMAGSFTVEDENTPTKDASWGKIKNLFD